MGGYEPVLGGAGAALVNRRCNPYGHETGGPKHLIGGVYGPQYEGPQKWVCERRAVLRARMSCQFGHRGQEMWLCRGHAIEIQKRQAGLCPKCAYPPEALMLGAEIELAQNELAVIFNAGDLTLTSPAARRIKQRIEDGGHRMTELYHTGVIKKEALTLREVS